MRLSLAVFWACAHVGLCGCGAQPAGSSGPAQLVPVATIASVSASQRFLAYYTNTGFLDDGALQGTLSVLPLLGGSAVMLADDCFAAAFGKSGEVLHYSTNPTLSTDGSDGGVGAYGVAHFWTPGLSNTSSLSGDAGLDAGLGGNATGGRLTSALATWSAMPPDGSFLLLVDAPKPSRSVAGEVVLARALDCAAGACRRIVLDSSAVVAAMAVSADGRFAAYVKKIGLGLLSQYETWLVNVALGTAVRVSHSGSFGGRAAVALSPDGSLLAAMTDAMKGGALVPAQLIVVSTATSLPVPWPPVPPLLGTTITGIAELQFADDKTLFVHLAGGPSDQGLFRTTALGTARYAHEIKAFMIAPAPDNRFLFTSTIATPVLSTSTGTTNVILYDLAEKSPVPVVMATQSAWPPEVAIGPDQATIAFTDGYDPTTRTASLKLLALAGGSITTLTTNLPVKSEATITAAGISLSSLRGTTASSAIADNFAVLAGRGLLYVDKPDSQGFGTLVGPVAVARGIERGVYNFQSTGPASVFVSISLPDVADHPIRTPGIYQVSLE